MRTPWKRVFGHGNNADGGGTGIAQLLSGIPIFDGLTKKEIAQVERILHRRQYVQDEIVFRQGEPGMGMYVIHSGTIAIVSEPENQQLSELHDGDFFGEVALLDESPRSATAIARNTCVMFALFQPDLFSLIEREPRLGVKILMRLARIAGDRLRRMNNQLITLTREMDALKRLRQPPAR